MIVALPLRCVGRHSDFSDCKVIGVGDEDISNGIYSDAERKRKPCIGCRTPVPRVLVQEEVAGESINVARDRIHPVHNETTRDPILHCCEQDADMHICSESVKYECSRNIAECSILRCVVSAPSRTPPHNVVVMVGYEEVSGRVKGEAGWSVEGGVCREPTVACVGFVRGIRTELVPCISMRTHVGDRCVASYGGDDARDGVDLPEKCG